MTPSYHGVDLSSDIHSPSSDKYVAYFGPNAWDMTLSFVWPRILDIKAVMKSKNCSSFCVHFNARRKAVISRTRLQSLKRVPSLVFANDMTAQKLLSKYNQYGVLLIKNYQNPVKNVYIEGNEPFSTLSRLYRERDINFCNCWNVRKGSKAKFSPHALLSHEELKDEPVRKRRKIFSGSVNGSVDWYVNFDIDQMLEPALYLDILDNLRLRDESDILDNILIPTRALSLLLGSSKKCRADIPIFDRPTEGECGFIGCSTIGCYQQCRGTTQWSISPDISQDWESSPPPTISTPSESLVFDMQSGDMLLLNSVHWMVKTEIVSSINRDSQSNIINPSGLCFGIGFEYKAQSDS